MFKKGIFGLKPVLYQKFNMAYIQVAKILWIIRNSVFKIKLYTFLDIIKTNGIQNVFKSTGSISIFHCGLHCLQ